MRAQQYDRIGGGYALRRKADPRLAAAISGALGEQGRLLNVGAGAGSYEPADRQVIAVEPSVAMIRQRPAGAARAVRACAEALPFADGAFASALAVLTIHHWADWRAGLREMVRVARHRVVLFTWDPQANGSWLADYFPRLLDEDRRRFPTMDAIAQTLGEIEVVTVPIPHDCTDGFMGAYWRRPQAYLDPEVRGAISSLATGDADDCLARLEDELSTGAWDRKHGHLLDCEELDLGYRLVISRSGDDAPGWAEPACGAE